MDIQDLKTAKEQKVSLLLKDCKVFFAFSNQQFEENKTPLEEGEKYVSIGAGGYMPKSQKENFNNGMDLIHNWYKGETKNNKLRKENILYELNNHEAFYTMSIDTTLEVLGSEYTRKEVFSVYSRELKKLIKADKI